jgi:hypothetical protein
VEIIGTVLAITIAQLPALLLRYIPFSKLTTKLQKKKLAVYYLICFIVENVILHDILSATAVNPLLYKVAIIVGGITYFGINCIVISNMFFKHIFVFSMQTAYSLVLHSCVAIVLSKYAHSIPPSYQVMIQSYTFVLLFALMAYPLWIVLKDSFILKPSFRYDYYWSIVWLLPALLCLGNMIITMNNEWISTWQQFLSRLAMGIAITISWICVNLDMKEIENKLAIQSANALLHIQIEAIDHQAKMIQENDEKLRILRHDLRHNTQILSSLLEKEDYSQAVTLLKHLNDDLVSTKHVVYCQNSIINASLLVYITKAEQQHITVDLKVDFPETLFLDSNDIAILFANTLENAIHASNKQPENARHIRLLTKYQDKKLAIMVENRFDNEILFDESGIPTTLQQGHGTGMTSISTIVSKYHGHMFCSHENGWFTIRFIFSELSA